MAKIMAKCPNCRVEGMVDKKYAGRKVKCKKCATEFVIQPPARQRPAPKAPPVSAPRTPAPDPAASAEASAELFTNPKDGYQMTLIPAGKAIFGSADDDLKASDDEKPQFEAELPGFYLGLYCVTSRQYAGFLNAVEPADGDLEKWMLLDSDCHVVEGGEGYSVDDEEPYGDHPVVQVSWYGAEAYCEWSGLRLPRSLWSEVPVGR